MKNAHWIVATLLAVFLVPALHVAHLPLRFAWKEYVVIFYWALFVQSMALGAVLFAIGYRQDFWRALSGKRGPRVNPLGDFAKVFLPATYLFFVFVLTFAYNDVIATFRFDGRIDPILNHIDSWLMAGHTVADLSHRISASQANWLEAVYFGMFPQIGACLLILALRQGRARALQFVGALATAYFIGLACFYFLPATGPYYLAATHRNGAFISASEMQLAHILDTLKDHQRIPQIGTDYFVAFPCLHITQPLIALWFLRKARGIVAFLAAYDLILIPAIILLQQHYLVDLIGGVIVAVLSVAAMDWDEARSMIGRTQAVVPEQF